ncbi:MAG: hypothetical protein FJW30_04650 [Acidobacteria bacterium]|nr:hypothetical protein [Acidobacteriota bacterium]
MGLRLDIDGAVKLLFEMERPYVLRQFSGGIEVEEFLNVELPAIAGRQADLVARLADGGILHLEFQTRNDRRMAAGLRSPQMRLDYQAIDIRDLPLEMTEGPGDCALRFLAAKTPREYAGVLEAIRRLPRYVRMELNSIGATVDVTKDKVLYRWYLQAVDLGREEGLEEGREQGRESGLEEGLKAGRKSGIATGMVHLLETQLESKFGPLPEWATARIRRATQAQMIRWSKKLLTAGSLAGVIGRKS